MPAKSSAVQGSVSRPRSGILGISGSRGVAKNRASFVNPRMGSARGRGLKRALNRSPSFGGAFGVENTPVGGKIGRRGSGDPVSPRTPFTDIPRVVEAWNITWCPESFVNAGGKSNPKRSFVDQCRAVPQSVEEDTNMMMFGSPRIGSAHGRGPGRALKRSPTFGGENTPATGRIERLGSSDSMSPRTPLADIAHALGAFGVQHTDMTTPARPQGEEEDTCMMISPNPIRGMKNRKPHLPRILVGSRFLTPQRNPLISMDAIENQVLEELQKLKRKRGKGKRKARDVCFRRCLRMAFEDCAECEDTKGLKQMIASLKRLGLL